MVTLLIAGFLLIIAAEVPGMAARGQTQELRAFWALLALSFVFSLGMVLRWPIPSPTDLLDAIFRPVSTALGLE